MGLYEKRLFKIRKDLKIEAEYRRKKRKKFKQNQKIMIDFINGLTREAVFNINNKKIVLRRGDSKKGFQHILERHYCKECDGRLSLLDILNFDLYLKRAIKLHQEGISNKDLEVFLYKKDTKSYKVVLKKVKTNNLVVTFYRQE